MHPCSRLNPGCGWRNTYQVSNEGKHKEPTLRRNCMPYTSGDFFSLKRATAHTRKKEVEVSFLLVENRKDHVMVLPSTKAVRSLLSMLTVFSKEEIKAASSKESSMAE